MRETDTSRAPLDTGARLHILDLGRLLAGPMVATLLGDMGAEVIKVEQPGVGDPARGVYPMPADGGDDLSYQWKVEGRNKRSITLQLSNPRGRELLQRLVPWADVLVENFRPGVMERWGLGPDDLHAANQRLVIVRVSGFGQTGPYRERAGLDFVGAGFAGLTYATGAPDRPPTTPGYPLCDYMAGAFGAMGALEALRRRDCSGGTGKGEVVDIALYEPVLRFSTPWLSIFDREGFVRVRDGSSPRPDDQLPQGMWGYSYETADGHWVSLLPSSRDDNRQRRLLVAIGRPELADDPRFATSTDRERNYKALDEVVRVWCARHDRATITAVFDEMGLACGPINSVADICADPHVQERNLVMVPDHRGEPLLMQRAVPRVGDDAGTVRWAGEPLGASNEEVYRGLLGLTDEEIGELEAAGVI
jgi:crotonobetainyl-CoA:carnitine CoA-transferase CaiB-like acyl-CoA transferase